MLTASTAWPLTLHTPQHITYLMPFQQDFCASDVPTPRQWALQYQWHSNKSKEGSEWVAMTSNNSHENVGVSGLSVCMCAERDMTRATKVCTNQLR